MIINGKRDNKSTTTSANIINMFIKDGLLVTNPIAKKPIKTMGGKRLTYAGKLVWWDISLLTANDDGS